MFIYSVMYVNLNYRLLLDVCGNKRRKMNNRCMGIDIIKKGYFNNYYLYVKENNLGREDYLNE